MKNFRLHNDESGGVLLEFIFFFPVVFLSFFIFIISGMLITQRVVLDRAVARAVTEASAWLSSDMLPVNQTNFFTGENFKLRTNPYVSLLNSFGNGVYHPMSRREFEDRVEELVRQSAEWSLVGGWARDNVDVYVAPLDNYFFAVDITVTATQQVQVPFMPRIADFQMQSTSTARVFRPHNLMNDIHFALDAARMAGLDVRKIRNYVDRVMEWLPSPN